MSIRNCIRSITHFIIPTYSSYPFNGSKLVFRFIHPFILSNPSMPWSSCCSFESIFISVSHFFFPHICLCIVIYTHLLSPSRRTSSSCEKTSLNHPGFRPCSSPGWRKTPASSSRCARANSAFVACLSVGCLDDDDEVVVVESGSSSSSSKSDDDGR